MRRFRRLNKFYARLLGYFWIPCRNCGTMFGGHECGGTLHVAEGNQHHGWALCWKCPDQWPASATAPDGASQNPVPPHPDTTQEDEQKGAGMTFGSAPESRVVDEVPTDTELREWVKVMRGGGGIACRSGVTSAYACAVARYVNGLGSGGGVEGEYGEVVAAMESRP